MLKSAILPRWIDLSGTDGPCKCESIWWEMCDGVGDGGGWKRGGKRGREVGGSGRKWEGVGGGKRGSEQMTDQMWRQAAVITARHIGRLCASALCSVAIGHQQLTLDPGVNR